MQRVAVNISLFHESHDFSDFFFVGSLDYYFLLSAFSPLEKGKLL